MGQIKLNGMEFYAYHGCYRDEQLTGNNFLVDIVMETDMEKASLSDNLNDTLNYVEVYEIVKHEMTIRSYLLEHVTARILDSFFVRFPQLVEATVSVTKLNPPIGGKVHSVCVSQGGSRIKS